MSDLEERMNIIWPWFNGNGNKGAGERLQALEDFAKLIEEDSQ